MIIKKKCWPEFFEKVLKEEKRFDVRIADFQCREGDILLLEEFDPKTKKYTGRRIEKNISYVLKTKDLKFWDKEEIDRHGFIILQLD